MAIFIPNTTGSYIQTSITGNVAIGSDMTVMCWVNLGSGPVNWRNFVTMESNFSINTYSDGTTFVVGFPGFNPQGTALTTGVWYHVAATIQSISTANHNVFGYVNGNIVISTTNTTSTFVAYGNVTIGNAYSSGSGTYVSPVNGSIRDVRIFTRVLRANEVRDNMHSALPVNPAALLLWAPLDDNSINDKGGNGHIFTAHGTTSIVPGYLQPYVKSNAMRWV